MKKQKLEMKSQREEREFQFRKEQAEKDNDECRQMQLNFQLEVIRLCHARPAGAAPAQNDQQGDEDLTHINESARNPPS